ncbi:MAG: helix-turn-helix domain-containing protein [Nitrospira sp.]|nr:MAG: helix-turn-helix domain-containing protein [Nitrospira sp.]
MVLDERLLTVGEAAARLGLKPATIRRMILNRRVETVRPSLRAVRIPESAVRRIIERGFRPAVINEERHAR